MMEVVACDLCGSGSATEVARQTDVIHRATDEVFTIVKCDNCGLCYTNPRPDAGSIGQYYTSAYSFFGKASTLRRIARRILVGIANSPAALIAGIVPPLSRVLAPRVMPRIKDPVRTAIADGVTGGLLDVGCGSGNHANFWGHSGAIQAYQRLLPVAGVEVSDDARAVLESYGIEAWKSIEAVPADRQWSLIRLNWSLEHVHHPSAFFAFIAAHLSPGGRAIICVPNYEGLLYKLAPSSVELPVHLYHFAPRHIERYATQHGLRVRGLLTFSYPAMFFTAVRLGMLDERIGGNAGVVEARRFQRVLTRFDRAGFGNDMVVVLERVAE